MSRSSNNIINEAGRIIDGYDYNLQVWIVSGRYQDCGHPEDMNCECFGRLHKGEENY